MTRQETLNAVITEGYDVDSKTGIIRSPGKFESEMFYAIYFYNIVLDGFAEDCGNGVSLIELDADDKREFHELADADYIVVECMDNGFVQIDTCSAASAEAIRENNPEDYDDE